MAASYHELQEILETQTKFLEAITASPMEIGVVISIKGDRCLINCSGKLLDNGIPPNVRLSIGDYVNIVTKTGAIFSKSNITAPGIIASVKKAIPGGVEIEEHGDRKFVISSIPLSVGDSILIDSSCSVVIKKLERSDDTYQFAQSTGVSWADIGGLQEAKSAIQEAIEIPYKHKDLYDAYKRKRSKGVLLYGPPGCGKTLLGKAAATSLANTHGETVSKGFFFVKGPEVLSKYVGESEANIRSLFASAKEFYKKNGYPAIIMIDEADALLGTRENTSNISMSKTIVPMFLSEMDGIDDSGAMVLLSTNRPTDLDSAVVRDGRIDRKIHVGRPDAMSSKDILDLNLRGVPVKEDDLSTFANSEIHSEERTILSIILKDGGVKQLLLRHILNGAVIAGIVEKAKEHAMRRDLSSGKVSGVSKQDITTSIDLVANEMKGMDHNYAIEEQIGDLTKVARINKISNPKPSSQLPRI